MLRLPSVALVTAPSDVVEFLDNNWSFACNDPSEVYPDGGAFHAELETLPLRPSMCNSLDEPVLFVNVTAGAVASASDVPPLSAVPPNGEAFCPPTTNAIMKLQLIHVPDV